MSATPNDVILQEQKKAMDNKDRLDIENRCLPKGWEAFFDDKGVMYYVNNETSENKWVKPENSLPATIFGNPITDLTMIIPGRLYNVSKRFLLCTISDSTNNKISFIDINMPENPISLAGINISDIRPIDIDNSDFYIGNFNKITSAKILLTSKFLEYTKVEKISEVNASYYYTLSDKEHGTPSKSSEKQINPPKGPYFFRKSQSIIGIRQPTSASNIVSGCFKPEIAPKLYDYFEKKYLKKSIFTSK